MFNEHPGLWFVVATLLPLASFVVLLLVGGLRSGLRGQRAAGGLGQALFELLGGDAPNLLGGYVATGAIALAFVCSLLGAAAFLADHGPSAAQIDELTEANRQLGNQIGKVGSKNRADLLKELQENEQKIQKLRGRWSDQAVWASVHPATNSSDPERAAVLSVGYYVDSLTVAMFVMVTLVASLIHLFSIGYMGEELRETVTDHEVHTAAGHLHRRGRFGRFFLFLSLFCFAMLNLVLADNLFQVFVSWELVGICSYLLIGFYYERSSAANAANKAFITNRIGDAGFIIGLLIVWSGVGTLNFQELFGRLRAPATVGPEHAHKIIYLERGAAVAGGHEFFVSGEGKNGSDVLLFPRQRDKLAFPPAKSAANPTGLRLTAWEHPEAHQFGYLPYWALVAAGLGIFLGCVGKSAQFPLQVWLPDAMEGPTPVSALIHAATMVAAGVYLVGRVYPLFTAEVLLTIAYTGAITLFVAATIALVMTDIKKVLAYSTVSQLGYMMLALGVGGWAAGLFHLLTHAFFKALLFLGSGSVIYGCHHQQDMRQMGGLFPKMKITALTMLVGCLAIAGVPLFSGWYSKDAILAQALGFSVVYQEHFLLFLLPLLTAGLTTFYMFRMWFMTFTGQPRDQHVYEHAQEAPWVMTVPLVVLAFFSVVMAWGAPPWDPTASALEKQLHHAQPASVAADFGQQPSAIGHRPSATDGDSRQPAAGSRQPIADTRTVAGEVHQVHSLAGDLALLTVVLGFTFASLLYYLGTLDPAEAKEQFAGLHRFLTHKWYFDELYSAILVRPGLAVAGWARFFDSKVIDGLADGLGRWSVWLSSRSGDVDRNIVDGLANLIADVSYAIGRWCRTFQTGYIRSYVLFLVLAAVSLWVLLSALLSQATGGP